jgi:hypothetical protein
LKSSWAPMDSLGCPSSTKKKKTNKYAHAYVLYIYNPYGLVGSTLVGEPCRLQ